MDGIDERFNSIGREIAEGLTPAWRRRRPAPANKLSRVMPNGWNYRYWPGPATGRGQRVRFCWSCQRNEAGYFLGWREVILKGGGLKRDRWIARRSRKRAKALAARRAGR